MKNLLILLILTLTINADYLNTKDKNHCIINLVPNNNKKGWCYHDQKQDRDECDKKLTMNKLINGYEYVDNKCQLKNDLKITGLTKNQWDYLMAVLAHIVGFTMLFLISFLSILIARK